MFIVAPSPNTSLSLPFPTGNKNNEPIEQYKPPRPHAQHPRGYQRNKRSNFLKLLALRWHVPPLPVRSCSCCCCCYLVAVVVAAAVTQFDNKYYKLDNNKNKKKIKETKRRERKTRDEKAKSCAHKTSENKLNSVCRLSRFLPHFPFRIRFLCLCFSFFAFPKKFLAITRHRILWEGEN